MYDVWSGECVRCSKCKFKSSLNFSKWLRVDPQATWYKVIEALTKAKENFLVNKIERKFLKSLFLSIMFFEAFH